MAQCSLGTLHECLANVGDTECGLVRRDDLVVDDGGQIQGHVVLGHTDLARHFDNLDLDVDCDESLTKRVNLDKTRVHSAFKSKDKVSHSSEFQHQIYIPAETRHQSDFTLLDGPVGVRARAAGDNSQPSDTFSDGVLYQNETLGQLLSNGFFFFLSGFDILNDAYHPCASGLLSSCWITEAYFGCKSDKRGG